MEELSSIIEKKGKKFNEERKKHKNIRNKSSLMKIDPK